MSSSVVGTQFVGNKVRVNLDVLSKPAVQYILLTAIVILAGVLRFYKLGQWSFWVDEIFTLQRAQAALSSLTSLFPPSTYLIALALRFITVNEWSLRLVPDLIGILSLPILYFPVRKMIGPTVALLTVFFLALSPWDLFWSQNARFYTALLFFYTLSMLFFYFAIEEDRPLYLILSLVFLGLATLERKVAMFYVPIVVVYLLALTFLPFEKPAGLRRRNLIIMALPVVLFGAFEIFQILFSGKAAFFSTFIEKFIGYHQNPVRVFLSVITDVGLPLFFLALAGGIYLLLRKSRAGLFLSLGIAIPFVTIVLMAPFTQVFSRYIFHTLAFWMILAAVAIIELLLSTQKYAWVIALAVLVIVVADAFSQDVLYYSFQNGNRQDWKGAYATIQQGLLPGDQVVTTTPEVGEYYMGKPVIWTQGLSPKQVVASRQRTWFVIDNRTGFVSPYLENWLPTNTRLVDVRDVYIPGKPLTMRVYLYTPPAP